MSVDPELYIDAAAALGKRNDAAATSTTGKQSIFALHKAIAGGFGLDAGSGLGTVKLNPNLNFDELAGIGTQEDAAATDTGTWSAVSLAKGILASAGP